MLAAEGARVMCADIQADALDPVMVEVRLAGAEAEIGWMVDKPKASMYIWAKIPEPYAAMKSLEFAKKLLADAKIAVSPGIGFGDYGNDYVRFALIENEHRTRQATRSIKKFLKSSIKAEKVEKA